MKRKIALALLLSLCAAAAPLLAADLSSRPAGWATPLADAGVENLYRVETDLYRSAQPTGTGFQKLAALGVKTVLDIAGGDGDGRLASGTSLKLFRVPMSAWGLKDDRVLEALRILTDPQNRPLLVHCRKGADRTGAIMALYRVVVQGWSKQDAIREMSGGGYHHSSFWSNLDDYVSRADVAALRKSLGVALPATVVQTAASAASPIAAPAPAR